MQGREEALCVMNLNLTAAQRNRKIVGPLVERGLVVASAHDKKVCSGSLLKSIGARHRNAQYREPGLAPEVTHERDKCLDFLLGRSGRQHNRCRSEEGRA